MKKMLNLVLSLTLIAGVCAAILAYVNQMTKGPIQEVTARLRTEAVKRVMPSGVETVEVSGEQFVGKNAAGQIVGYAAEGLDEQGYGGPIRLMVGFEADRRTVVVYQKLEASETPGLGAKLTTDEFSAQFVGKDARALKVKKDGGDIEAITGATITSRAVCRAIAAAQAKLTEDVAK